MNVTGHIFLQDSIKNVAVFNNTFSTPANRMIISVWFGAGATSLPGGAASGNSAYNNSINAGGHRSGMALFADNQVQFTAVNNVLAGGLWNIHLYRGTTLSSAGVNHNLYRDLFAAFGDSNNFGLRGASYRYISGWRSACRCDSASTMVTGALISTFTSVSLASADGALSAAPAPAPTDTETMVLLSKAGEGGGLNLSDIARDDLAALAQDKNGKDRPAAGPWNIGPY